MADNLDKVQAVLDFLEQETTDPWDIGLLQVRRDGCIVRRAPDAPLRFAFRCFGIPVAALVEPGGARFRLSLKAVLGNIPFTGEAAEARRQVLGRIRSTEGLLVTDGREVGAQSDMQVAGPLTPASLLAHLSGFMLALKPEIEALAPCLPDCPAARAAA